MDAPPERYVPSELVDYFIAFIPKRQTKTLLACSLVCRQWYPVVRRHLYYTYKVNLKPTEGRSLRQFTVFLEENREISRCIHNLTLYTTIAGHEPFCSTISSGSLVLILRQLSSLESLALKRLRIGNDVMATAEPRRLRSLTFEGLYCSAMPHVGDIVDILSLFNYVGSLQIYSLRIETRTGEHIPVYGPAETESVDGRLRTPLPSLKIGRLTIDRQERTSSFLRLIRFSGSVETLAGIFVHCTTRSDLESLAQLLNSVGARLRSLTVQILWLGEEYEDIIPAVHLDTAYSMLAQALLDCANLDTFVLYQWVEYTNSPAVPCQRIVSLVNNLPTTLARLRIDIDDEINDAWDLFDDHTWEALRVPLRRLGSLRSLELSAKGIEGDGHMRNTTRYMVKEQMQEFGSILVLR